MFTIKLQENESVRTSLSLKKKNINKNKNKVKNKKTELLLECASVPLPSIVDMSAFPSGYSLLSFVFIIHYILFIIHCNHSSHTTIYMPLWKNTVLPRAAFPCDCTLPVWFFLTLVQIDALNKDGDCLRF